MFAGAMINNTEGTRRAPCRLAQPLDPADPRRRRGRHARGQPGSRPDARVLRRVRERRLERAHRQGHHRRRQHRHRRLGPRPGDGHRGPAALPPARPAGPLRLQRRRHPHGRDPAKRCRPETTLFIVASKTFTTQETIDQRPAPPAPGCSRPLATKRRSPSISSPCRPTPRSRSRLRHRPANMFEFWDWVGGRYSLWSAIGLSIALSVGMDRFEELLAGGHAMDEHFRTAPLRGQHAGAVWRCSGSGTPTSSARTRYAVLPYDQYLHRFPAYLQQARHGEQRQVGHPRRRGCRLHHRADPLGRARHQRPARLLPAHPPGHPARPLRLPRPGARATTRSATITRSCSPTSSPRPRR